MLFLTVSGNYSAEKEVLSNLDTTRLLFYQIADSLTNDSLEIILRDYEHKPVPLYIVYREGRYSSVNAKTLIDRMVDQLRVQTLLN